MAPHLMVWGHLRMLRVLKHYNGGCDDSNWVDRSIAAGKSTVATHLRELDATLVDYDVLARKVVEPGSVGLQRIVEHFGPDAMNAQGGLNRRWMSEHVFSDPNAESERRILDDIEHPLIYDLALSEERQAVEKNPDAVVVHDIPLLAEVIDDIPMRFDHIVTVEAPEQTRVERMMRTRGMSEAQAKARIAHQPRVRHENP